CHFVCEFLYVIIPVFCPFFFQAEDGIRDRNVTGVQTCALPIFLCFIVVQPGMAQISPGKTVSGWEKQGNIITIPTTNAEVKLEFCTPSMVRVRASWDGEFAEPEPDRKSVV